MLRCNVFLVKWAKLIKVLSDKTMHAVTSMSNTLCCLGDWISDEGCTDLTEPAAFTVMLGMPNIL